ncbi:unnamed protein product [Echinostoma caproni]|uniref:Uncharacterized protein n=1 Tax=Echinostoma caproni TaxID=27848 RepID=A0A3P8LBG0_9TREM|nr:unnamed protein product [Echinostoma caproni]
MSQDDGENRITQATFTIMTPTSRTEVTYHEDSLPVSSMDPETLKQLQLMREEKLRQSPQMGTEGLGETEQIEDPGNCSTARTKTTVRKTVIASAAKATFVATGTSKPPKNALILMGEGAIQDTEKSVKFDPGQFHEDILNQVDPNALATGSGSPVPDGASTHTSGALVPIRAGNIDGSDTLASGTGSLTTSTTSTTTTNTTTTTTTTTGKRTTRIGNNLVNKR